VEVVHQILLISAVTHGILLIDLLISLKALAHLTRLRHEELKTDFTSAFDKYFCPVPPGFVINVELISSLVCKLKWGKAAGYDGLTADMLTLF